jgi:hypothetical protein
MVTKGGRGIPGAIILESTAEIDKKISPIANIVCLVLPAMDTLIFRQHINPELTETIMVIRNIPESITDDRNSEYVFNGIVKQY